MVNQSRSSFIKVEKKINEAVGGKHIISERVWIFHLYLYLQGSTLIFLAARQSGLLLPDAAGPDQMFTGPDQLFVSEVRKCIITWFSLADTKQFQSHFTLNI